MADSLQFNTVSIDDDKQYFTQESHQAHSDSKSSQFDHFDFESLKDFDLDMIKLLPGYLKRREEDLERMLDALEKKQFQVIQEISHQIKGSASSYGLETLESMALELEEHSSTLLNQSGAQFPQQHEENLKDKALRAIKELFERICSFIQAAKNAVEKRLLPE